MLNIIQAWGPTDSIVADQTSTKYFKPIHRNDLTYLVTVFIYTFKELSSKHLNTHDSKDKPKHKTNDKYIGYRRYCFEQGIYNNLQNGNRE